MKDFIVKSALFSSCGRYRYLLSRVWEPTRPESCWIMLNPSMADGERDDPTIRRCMGFAKSWGHGGIVVVNLFGLISTFPAGLRVANPVGSLNDEAIVRAVQGRRVICAWGNIGGLSWLRPELQHRDLDVMALLERTRTNAQCLGLTRFGYPSHPVRLAAKSRLRPFVLPRNRGVA